LESESSWVISQYNWKMPEPAARRLLVMGHFFSYVFAVASEVISIKISPAGHIRLRYVMGDCTSTAVARSAETMTLRIVVTGCDRGWTIIAVLQSQRQRTPYRALREAVYLS
jgi:hypothetical protein